MPPLPSDGSPFNPVQKVPVQRRDRIFGQYAIYTIKDSGLQEDVIYDKAPKTAVSLRYRLSLPSSLAARMMPNGSLGIYSGDPALFGNISYGSPADQLKVAEARQHAVKNNLVFILPVPQVITSDGRLSR